MQTMVFQHKFMLMRVIIKAQFDRVQDEKNRRKASPVIRI